MLWGKPMWGAYWQWDPRLTSELVLLFLYFGYMGLRAAHRRPGQKADKASAVLAMVGRNQRAYHQVLGGVVEFAAPDGHRDAARQADDGLVAWCGRCCSCCWRSRCTSSPCLLIRLRAELLRRERNASWVREVLS